METFSGIVSEILSTKWKNKMLYSVKMEDTGTIFGTGTNKPTCESGDGVTFKAEKNKKGYWDMDFDSLEVRKGEGRKAAEAAGVGYIPADKNARFALNDANDRRNKSVIALQSCRNSAIAAVTSVPALDELIVNAKDPVAMVEKLVKKFTEKFYNENLALYKGEYLELMDERALTPEEEEEDLPSPEEWSDAGNGDA